MGKSIWDTRFGKRGIAQDERVQVEEGDSWKTIHGARVLIGINGEIKAGAEGKFNGMTLEGFGRPNEEKWMEHKRNINSIRTNARREGSDALQGKKGIKAPTVKELGEFYKKTAERSLEYTSRYEQKNPPKALTTPMSENDAINRIGGEDKTEGSCASASIAFVANQELGLDVRDFRGGASEIDVSVTWGAGFAEVVEGGYDEKKEGGRVWSIKGNINESTRNAALKALDTMQPNKNYIAALGDHQSVVRKTETGEIQYLELQGTGAQNGWRTLMRAPNDERISGNQSLRYKEGSQILEERFAMEDRRIFSDLCGIVPADRYAKTKFVSDRLQYVNTSESRQMKGSGGSIK